MTTEQVVEKERQCYEEQIDKLKEEIEKLETKIEDQNSEIEALALAPIQLERLTEAADWAVERGLIYDTPSAKRRWMLGL